MVIIASTANSNLHQLQNFNSQSNNSNHLRDASFSSYLNSNEETFAESSQSFNPFISSRKDPIHQGIKKEEDGEIGVFEAEKYFNGGELLSPKKVADMDAKKYQYHHCQKDEQTALETGKYKGKYGTPSVGSESSWNSQSALLQSHMRDSSRNRNKVQRKSFLAGLGCKCSCSDKNSVDVSDHAGEVSFHKTANATYGVDHGKTTPKKHFNADLDANHSVKITKPHAELLINNKNVYFQKQEKLGVGLNRENGLAFSTVNSGLGNQPVKMQLQEVEKPKKSLEVFGSPVLDSRSKSLSFDKRLAMPSWEAAPKMEEIDLAANSGENYNDAESDASSDLFEIESLTGKANPFLARPTSCDVASGCASPTTCYAPSEASIEWSVVTASAVEYSTMSDCEDQRSVATIRSPIRPPPPLASSNGKPKVGKEVHRRRPGMLLGCKSQKAVGVAVDAFTTCEKPSSNPQFRRRSDTFAQVTRFQAETKEGNFGSRHGQQHAYASTSPMQRSHSPHASQLLYI